MPPPLQLGGLPGGDDLCLLRARYSWAECGPKREQGEHALKKKILYLPAQGLSCVVWDPHCSAPTL